MKDTDIGYYIDNLIYIWERSEKWYDCKRTYLLPFSTRKNFIPDNIDNCEIVKNFFSITSKVPGVKLRKNGQNIGTFLGKSVEEIYREMEIAVPKKTIMGLWKTRIITNCISRSLMNLRPHQQSVVKYLENHRGVVAAHDVGTGKTLLAAAASQCFLDRNPKSQVFVVTPKSLQINFRETLEEKYGANPKDRRYNFFTISKFAREFHEKEFPKGSFLIVDEAHNLRTNVFKSKAKVNNAKVVIETSKKALKVLLLTATPFYNEFYDIVNLVSIVKGLDPLTVTKFENIKMNKDQFRNYVQGVFSIHRNEELELFPEVREHNVFVEMDPDYYKNYLDIELTENMFYDVENPWAFLVGMREASNGLMPYQKTNAVMNIIYKGQKTVVYSAFITFGIDIIKEILDREDIPYVEITGKMTMKQRNQAVQEFNSEDGADVLFITKAGGEGIDLVGTRNIIHLESGWNREGEHQINGRGARRGSHMHLPEEERYLDIYYIMLTKPSGWYEYELPMVKNSSGDPREPINSSDILMKEKFIQKKEERGKEVMDILSKYSIENGYVLNGGNYTYLIQIQNRIIYNFVNIYGPEYLHIEDYCWELGVLKVMSDEEDLDIVKILNKEMGITLKMESYYDGGDIFFYVLSGDSENLPFPKDFLIRFILKGYVIYDGGAKPPIVTGRVYDKHGTEVPSIYFPIKIEKDDDDVWKVSKIYQDKIYNDTFLNNVISDFDLNRNPDQFMFLKHYFYKRVREEDMYLYDANYKTVESLIVWGNESLMKNERYVKLFDALYKELFPSQLVSDKQVLYVTKTGYGYDVNIRELNYQPIKDKADKNKPREPANFKAILHFRGNIDSMKLLRTWYEQKSEKRFLKKGLILYKENGNIICILNGPKTYIKSAVFKNDVKSIAEKIGLRVNMNVFNGRRMIKEVAKAIKNRRTLDLFL